MESKWIFNILLLMQIIVSCSSRTFKVALLGTECCGSLSLSANEGALTLGLEEVKRNILSDEHDFSVVWKNDRMNKRLASGYTQDLILNGTDVIFGSPFSSRNDAVALLTGYNNCPHITWVGMDPQQGDKALFNTLVRTLGHFGKIGPAIVALLKQFGWQRVGIISPEKDYERYATNGVLAALDIYNITVTERIYYADRPPSDNYIVSFLGRLKMNTRIIFLSANNQEERNILLKARELGMCNGEYVFLLPNILYPDGIYRPFYRNDSLDAAALNAYRCTYELAQSEGPNVLEYRKMVSVKAAEAPFFNNQYLVRNLLGSNYAPYLHDAAILYGLWLNYSLSNNLDPRDGKGLFAFTKNVTFIGKSGPVSFDSNGDRQPTYTAIGFNYDDGVGRAIADLDTAKPVEEACNIYGSFKWMTHDGRPPPDVPACGFYGEFCIESSDTVTIVVSTVLPAVALISLFLAFIGWRWRKRKEEELLSGQIWRIDINDIIPIHSNIVNSVKSLISIARTSRPYNDDTESTVLMHTVGVYQGIHVIWKEVIMEQVALNREALLDLKCMKEISQENLNPFIGAAIDGLKVTVVYKFCKKLSLQDILGNAAIQLDWMFKFSFISDIVSFYIRARAVTLRYMEEENTWYFSVVMILHDTLVKMRSRTYVFEEKMKIQNRLIRYLVTILGMHFLHATRLKSHGKLTSSNCVVDGRWVLKITDYGMEPFISKQSGGHNGNLNKLLWTAPELLRLPEIPPRGTPASDVYSFGIILNEIYYRDGGFYALEVENEEIIKRVRNVEVPPFRPPKGCETDVPKMMVKMLDYCLEEDPTERPPFGEIRKYIRIHNRDQECGIMDLMVKKMEKYATHLEEIVETRTMDLVEEKKKTDALLHRMLPPSIAETLKRGEPIDPEFFDQVTIYFSDIVGFTTISAQSKPIDVVDLLNDLYSAFDSIIEKYDAYKVETIGDAYMVSSGLPIRNGMKHTSEIACMSLDILSCVMGFRIRHLPERKLQIRIGFNTGPCCAGVVGHATPKYCLFGDTVNTASRMESNGESMRIHISHASKKVLESLGGFDIQVRGEMQIKGKGLMTTYWLAGQEGYSNQLPDILSILDAMGLELLDSLRICAIKQHT